MPRYINGLIFEIQDEISLFNLKTIEYAYQEALRVEEKILRKQNQKNRGRGSSKGLQIEEVGFKPLRMR